ncbi:YhgE/Pip family protein [Microterricola viridarii]|uniref:Putative membrane protein n=1 Tax=Microterricola viridarii TaxID=412690 RepID=A0A1H1Z9U8_9MICO|nr:YhgE/Pip family protein [Microterricola viridarii]SDT30450.1 putative membrane protein [Microterricola viridarii]
MAARDSRPRTGATAPSRLAATSGSERIGRLTLIGLLLVPLLIGGVLSWALAAPTTHLDRVTAAIVNNDEPVTVNGNTVPLGRQFSAGLIAGQAAGTDGGTDTVPQAGAAPNNFSWVLTNGDEAAAGLRSGRYAAVVTIPSSFSATAMSIGGPASAATQAALQVQTTPATAFLDPALTQAITRTAAASLNQQLIEQYLDNVYAGFNTLNQQIGQASSGADSLASGASSLDSGAQSLASGAGQLNAGASSLDTGAAALADGLSELDSAAQPLPGQTAQLAAGAAQVAAAADALSAAVVDATSQFTATVAQLCLTPGVLCDRATAALTRLQSANQGAAQLAGGADQVASGNAQLAAGMGPLVDGIDSSASGAEQLADGAAQLSDGAASLSVGAQSVAAGAAQVDSGAAQLSSGLQQAVAQIPTYSDSDISTLSAVVSAPVLVEQAALPTGFQSVPLFAVVALWLGGLVLAIARRAVPTRLLLTAAPTTGIALRSLGLTAAFGAAQGVVVGVVVLTAVAASPLQWLSFAGACLAIGAVFAVLNQGLAAAFGAVGRLLAAAVAVVALAAGLSGTVPPAIAGIAGALPTAPALQLLLAALTRDAGSALAGLLGLLLWALLGAALVYAGVAVRRRTAGDGDSISSGAAADSAPGEGEGAERSA